MRRQPSDVEEHAARMQKLKEDLVTLRNVSVDAGADDVNIMQASSAFDQLSETEKSAASLGVHPNAMKPIGFMNAAHYASLLKSNALDDTLARRIEAFRTVAGRDAEA